MAVKKVLLIESGHFIGGVIHSLFSSCDKVTVVEAAPANPSQLLRAIRKHKPAVIVLDDTVHTEYLDYLLHYMQSSEAIRVVVVNTDSNLLEIYQKQRVNINHPADFFAAL